VDVQLERAPVSSVQMAAALQGHIEQAAEINAPGK
jgi:hypothetical protein